MVKSHPNKQETDASSFQGSSAAGAKFEPFGPGAWVQQGRRTLVPTHPTSHFPASILQASHPLQETWALKPRRFAVWLRVLRLPNEIPLVFLRVGVVDIFITLLVITAGLGPLP